MFGTKISIAATTPYMFSTEDEKAAYTEWVGAIVKAHGAADVTVTCGEQVEFTSALSTANEAGEN